MVTRTKTWVYCGMIFFVFFVLVDFLMLVLYQAASGLHRARQIVAWQLITRQRAFPHRQHSHPLECTSRKRKGESADQRVKMSPECSHHAAEKQEMSKIRGAKESTWSDSPQNKWQAQTAVEHFGHLVQQIGFCFTNAKEAGLEQWSAQPQPCHTGLVSILYRCH